MNNVELEYFEEQQLRFEINGIDSDERIPYVEEQLERHGIRPKYVPPEDELAERVEEDFEATIRARVGLALNSVIDEAAIVDQVTEELRGELQLDDAEEFIRESLEIHPYEAWDSVLDKEHRRRVLGARGEIEAMVRDHVVTMVTDDYEDGE